MNHVSQFATDPELVAAVSVYAPVAPTVDEPATARNVPALTIALIEDASRTSGNGKASELSPASLTAEVNNCNRLANPDVCVIVTPPLVGTVTLYRST